jgi:arginine decarboxylase
MRYKNFFFTSGEGEHYDSIVSFGLALKDAGVAGVNLVKVSSILPPGCKLIEKKQGIKKIKQGEIVHCVLAENYTQEEKIITSGIGVIIPENPKNVGCFYEITSEEESEEKVIQKLKTLSYELFYKTINGKKGEFWGVVKKKKGKKGMWNCVVVLAVLV